MRKLVLLLLVIVVLNTVGLAKAATVEERLARLEAMVQTQQKEIQALKADKVKLTRQVNQVKRATAGVNQKKVNAMVSKAISTQKVDAGVPAWVNDFKFKGDLRYRYEYTDDDASNGVDNRNRIRLRFGFDAKVNDEVDVEVRLATGASNSANGTNQTLDDEFGRKDIFIDLAYFNYHPDAIDNLNIYGGKVKNPFVRVGGSEMIWDVDVTPEGGALTYHTQLDSDLTVFANMGAFYVQESATEADSSLMAVQGGLKYALGDQSYAMAGASYYDFGNIRGNPSSGMVGRGNTVSGGNYTNDYDVVEAFGEIGFPVCDMPFRIFGDYAKNIGALSANAEDSAWLIGAGIGKCNLPGSWELVYHYKDVEADAVVSHFKDGTFAGGNTDSKGHIFGFGYQVAESLQFRTTWYNSETNTSNSSAADHEALLLDLIFKF